MKRYHLELERTKRVHGLHLRRLLESPGAPVDCVYEFQVGRFRKRKAFGCGRPRCLLCHYEKIYDIASTKERIRERRFLDSLNDYFNGDWD